MGTFITVVIVIIFLCFLANKQNKSHYSNSDEKEVNRDYDNVENSICESAHQSAEEFNSQYNENMNSETIKLDTQGLMINTLRQLGCLPRTNEDGTLFVQYQGENFHMEFGGMYTRVWDPMWAGIKVDDPDLPIIREAVNATNFNFGPTVVMTNPDDEGVIGFHSRRDIMLHPACPDNVPFVKAVLDSFFDTKEQVRSNFQQINAKQMERQKNRRPVGFTTTHNE